MDSCMCGPMRLPGGSPMGSPVSAGLETTAPGLDSSRVETASRGQTLSATIVAARSTTAWHGPGPQRILSRFVAEARPFKRLGHELKQPSHKLRSSAALSEQALLAGGGWGRLPLWPSRRKWRRPKTVGGRIFRSVSDRFRPHRIACAMIRTVDLCTGLPAAWFPA